MAISEPISAHKWEILSQLKLRNDDEKNRYSEIVQLTNNLYDALDFHQKENLRLQVRLQKGTLEKDDHFQKGDGCLKSIDGISLENKYFQMQDELNELHKEKSEYAHQVIDLRSSLDETGKNLLSKCAQIQELEEKVNACQLDSKGLQQKLLETELILQFTKDEYSSLLVTYSGLEQKNINLERDKEDMITQMIHLKLQIADLLNAERERVERQNQSTLQQELKEAIDDHFTPDQGIPCSVGAEEVASVNVSLPSKIVYCFEAHDGEINALAWSQNGRRFVTAGSDRKVKFWEVTAGQPSLRGVAHESNSSVYSVDFNSEETLLLGASGDFASRVWDIRDFKIKHTLTGHSGKVMSAKFLGESSRVVSGSHDRTLKIWDLCKRTCIKTIFADSCCNDVASSDQRGTNFISGHFDRKIRFWDMRSESSTNEIFLQGRITSLDVSIDGFSLLSCVRDDTLKLIDFRMNTIVKTFRADGFLVGCDWTRAKFSPDGEYCICGSQNGSVYIWSISSGSVETILTEHKTTVICCAWSLDGNYMISCDRNKRAVLWSSL